MAYNYDFNKHTTHCIIDNKEYTYDLMIDIKFVKEKGWTLEYCIENEKKHGFNYIGFGKISKIDNIKQNFTELAYFFKRI